MLRANYDNVDAVVFDFGGVISVSPMSLWEHTLFPYCESLGVPREVMRCGFRKYRNLWDGDETDFAGLYARMFADAGQPPPSPETLKRLYELDPASWVAQLRPDTLELLSSLKTSGKRLALLSNMASQFFDDFFVPRCAEYRKFFELEVISGHERTCKPDRPIYDLVVKRLGVSPERLLFYDDTERNVFAARAYGWQAELYV